MAATLRISAHGGVPYRWASSECGLIWLTSDLLSASVGALPSAWHPERVTPEQAAEEIVAHRRAISVADHRYVEADARNFGHLDGRFYERFAKASHSLGFVSLGDLEDRTLTEAPGSATKPMMIRMFRSADGQVASAAYHSKSSASWFQRLRIWLHGMGLHNEKCIDLVTEFEDGTFLVTSNAQLAERIDAPAEIERHFLPGSSDLHQLVEHHRAQVNVKRSASGEARPVLTLSEAIALAQRIDAAKARFREAQLISREELLRLAGRKKATAEEVFDAIEGQLSGSKEGRGD